MPLIMKFNEDSRAVNPTGRKTERSVWPQTDFRDAKH